MTPDTDTTSPAAPKPASASPAERVDYSRQRPTLLNEASHQLHSLRRTMRRNFSRDNILQGLKTLGWVAPLTLLLWIYAEREQVAIVRDFVVPIELRSADPTKIVSLSRQMQDKNLVVEMSGPRAAVDRVREQIGPGSLVPLEVDRNLTPGQTHALEATRLLNHTEVFTNNGVTVTACTPSTLQVYVDELVEEQMPIEVPPEVNNLAGRAAFDPPMVTISGPKSAVEPQKASGHVYADLSEVLSLTPGEHTITNVRIKPLQDPSLSVQPKAVRATVNVRDVDQTTTITSMPVWPMPAPGLSDQYRFTLNQTTLANVKVVGPPELIKQIDDGAFRPKAIVEINSVAPGAQQQSLSVKYDLPQGVRATAEALDRKIDVTATRRGED